MAPTTLDKLSFSKKHKNLLFFMLSGRALKNHTQGGHLSWYWKMLRNKNLKYPRILYFWENPEISLNSEQNSWKILKYP